jgi:hypothetical protein
MTETYEQLRDGATGAGAETCRQANREQCRLRTLYSSPRVDPRLTQRLGPCAPGGGGMIPVGQMLSHNAGWHGL